MARPSTTQIYLLMYGRKPIAAFQQKQNAEKAFKVLKDVIPSSYPVKPKLMTVPLQG